MTNFDKLLHHSKFDSFVHHQQLSNPALKCRLQSCEFIFILFSHYQSTAGGDPSMLFPLHAGF